jgi:DNA-binding NarL/FixJ family response regulator
MSNRAAIAWLARDRAHRTRLMRLEGPDPCHFEVTAVKSHRLAILRRALPIHDATDVVDARARRWKLTVREHDVLVHIAAGLSNKRVAAAMQLAEATVETHVTRIFRKSGVESRAALLACLLTGIERHA